MPSLDGAFRSLFETNMGIRGNERVLVFSDTIRPDETIPESDRDRRLRLNATARQVAAFAAKTFGSGAFVEFPPPQPRAPSRRGNSGRRPSATRPSPSWNDWDCWQSSWQNRPLPTRSQQAARSSWPAKKPWRTSSSPFPTIPPATPATAPWPAMPARAWPACRTSTRTCSTAP